MWSPWLLTVALGLTGIVLYAVATYDYFHAVDRAGLYGLRGWVRFYHEHNFVLLVTPLVGIAIGIVGLRITLGRVSSNMLGEARRGLKTMTTSAWLRPAAHDGLRLLVVIVVATVVGYYAGHWDAGEKNPRGYPVYQQPSYRLGESPWDGERRISRLEREVSSLRNCINYSSRLGC